MSYDLYFECDPFERPVPIMGGTYQVGGTTEARLNITYNYAPFFREYLGPKGIRSLYGLRAAEVVERLGRVIPLMTGDPDPDYWPRPWPVERNPLCPDRAEAFLSGCPVEGGARLPSTPQRKQGDLPVKLKPDDTIIWCAGHAAKDLWVFGSGRRDLAPSKLKGLLRANGVNPLGFEIRQTITLPKSRQVIRSVTTRLYARVEAAAPVFLDNRDTLMGEAIGTLVVYDTSWTTARSLMSRTRADLDRQLAATVAG
jgi:hypothetical protein